MYVAQGKVAKAYMIKHEAIQLGIAKFGGVCNSWRHDGFLTSAHSWSKDCPQLNHDWYMTKDKEPELGINQICCNTHISIVGCGTVYKACIERRAGILNHVT